MHRSYGLSDVPRVRRLAPLLSHGGASHLLTRGQKLTPTRAKFCAHRLSPSRTCPSLLKLGPLGDLSAHSLPRLASLARRIRHDKEKLDRTGQRHVLYVVLPAVPSSPSSLRSRTWRISTPRQAPRRFTHPAPRPIRPKGRWEAPAIRFAPASGRRSGCYPTTLVAPVGTGAVSLVEHREAAYLSGWLAACHQGPARGQGQGLIKTAACQDLPLLAIASGIGWALRVKRCNRRAGTHDN